MRELIANLLVQIKLEIWKEVVFKNSNPSILKIKLIEMCCPFPFPFSRKWSVAIPLIADGVIQEGSSLASGGTFHDSRTTVIFQVTWILQRFFNTFNCSWLLLLQSRTNENLAFCYFEKNKPTLFWWKGKHLKMSKLIDRKVYQ